MSKTAMNTQTPLPRTLIVCVHSPYNPLENFESYCAEFRNLVYSSNREFERELIIKLRAIEPASFFTKGKLNEIAQICEQEHIEEVVISEPLSVAQQRNLQELLHCPVVDRTLLILEIFERGAVSSEGKKQVARARFQYEKSRLAGKGVHMSQQAGRIGTRGPGETAKEKETHHLERLMTKLQRDLVHLQEVRKTQRKKRISGNLPLMCLIGYTNAGKSTILNQLTKSNVLAENKLFSTLDTTTRELYIDHKKVALISDTVGFIQQLPHQLVEAFKSTLSELEHADLLLHVIDLSDTNWQHHSVIVNNVLEELGVHTKPVLYVFNKIDKVDETGAKTPLLSHYIPHALVSAQTPNGLAPLIEYLRTFTAEFLKQRSS